LPTTFRTTMSKKKSERPLQRMFTDVPPKYDLVNRIFTLRLDERWRKRAAQECLKNEPEKILDLCTGTGDLALHLAKISDSKTKITGVDFSQTMLEVAEKKKAKLAVKNVDFVFGDAAKLPFQNQSFDVVGISFAFRNLTFRNPDTPLFLSEIVRVLKKNGKFIIVESSIPGNRLWRNIMKLYMNLFVRHLGALITGNKGAYRYFAYSVTHFYTPAEIEQLLLDAGFKSVRHRNFVGGVAALHIAES